MSLRLAVQFSQREVIFRMLRIIADGLVLSVLTRPGAIPFSGIGIPADFKLVDDNRTM